MPLTYVVGFDGGDASESAVHLATRLASSTSAEVIVATALTEQLGHAAWSRATEDAHALLARLTDLDVTVRVLDGPAPHALHDLAAETDAALLFVGATHRGAFGRLAPGSVGERLLHAAPCPLVVVPTRTDRPLDTVAVAFDGRDASHTALTRAQELAEDVGAQLLVFTANAGAGGHHHLLTPTAPTPIDVDAVMISAGELLGADAHFGHRILSGPAAPALVAACAEGVDLLVVGSRGYGPIQHVLAGSVSRHRVDHAPCPVLVVPRAHSPRHLPRALRHAQGSAT